MSALSPADLILRPQGSVYHLNLLPHQISKTIIAVGDPQRVSQVSRHFDEIEYAVSEREFITHTGWYHGKRLTVISTGIGTDNVEIVMTELDALVNIDLGNRSVKPQHERLRIIRIGTSGSLQGDIQVGSHVASMNAAGLDNLMQFYDLPQSSEESEVGRAIQKHCGFAFTPYVVRASDALATSLAYDMKAGTTLTAPGFYAPQGRELRIAPRYGDLLSKLGSFALNNVRLTNFEMETAGYYGLGRMLGHDTLSLNAIIANRVMNEFSPHPEKVVDDLIQLVLPRIAVIS